LADHVSALSGTNHASCLGLAGSEKSTTRVPRPYHAVTSRFWSGACQKTWMVQPASGASFGWYGMLNTPALSSPFSPAIVPSGASR
jgi:hypothetical protein